MAATIASVKISQIFSKDENPHNNLRLMKETPGRSRQNAQKHSRNTQEIIVATKAIQLSSNTARTENLPNQRILLMCHRHAFLFTCMCMKLPTKEELLKNVSLKSKIWKDIWSALKKLHLWLKSINSDFEAHPHHSFVVYSGRDCEFHSFLLLTLDKVMDIACCIDY